MFHLYLYDKYKHFKTKLKKKLTKNTQKKNNNKQTSKQRKSTNQMTVVRTNLLEESVGKKFN